MNENTEQPHEGRMISFSKSGYPDRHPEHVAIFNAVLATEDRKVWWGDLDLTLDEPWLLQFAAAVGERLYVLSEADGSFGHEEQPRLERAWASFDPDETVWLADWLERRRDGRIAWRPDKSTSSPRGRVTPIGWDGRRRPRLLRFWKLERRSSSHNNGRERNLLLYIGERGGPTPLLILGLHRTGRPSGSFSIEVTFHVSRRPHRRRPLYQLVWGRPRGRVRPLIVLTVWPGYTHVLILGVQFGAPSLPWL